MKMRYATAAFASFVFIFIYSWVFHGIFLDESYKSLSHLYRPEADMGKYFLWLVGGQMTVSIGLVGLLARAAPTADLKDGAILGFFLGLLPVGSQFASYAVMPFPFELVLWWTAGSLIQMTLLGMLIADLVKEH